MIRVLLDECLPVKLKYRLAEQNPIFVVSTVMDEGWSGTKNGMLLRKAEETFDVFITIDQNMVYQQHLSHTDMAIISIESFTNRYEDLKKLINPISDLLVEIKKGKVYTIILEDESR